MSTCSSSPIAAVETTPVNGVIDIIGVVETVGEYMDITLKNGSATHKRSVQLKDQSNASIEVRTLVVCLLGTSMQPGISSPSCSCTPSVSINALCNV